MLSSSSRIKSSFTKLKPQDSWAFKDAPRSITSSYTHNYHRYPAKFIPQLVRKLILKNTVEGETICDPFGGCGTTIVEAKLAGRKSVGVDINPIAKLITQTKITPIKPSILAKEIDIILNEITRVKSKRKANDFNARLRYWFNISKLKKLDQIYVAINKTKNPACKRFFYCAFSHILKNSSLWLMKSIKPTVDKGKVVVDPVLTFRRHLLSMQKMNALFYKELESKKRLDSDARFFKGDSTKRLPIESNSIELIITSPPYVTSYEYADLHQLSLLWFGNDNKNFKHWNNLSNDFGIFRKKFIGTRYKKYKSNNLHSKIAEEIVADLWHTNRSVAMNVANYFSDMYKSFREMYSVLRRNKLACVIVGNTSLRGVEILNAEVAAEQMTAVGFKKVQFIKREFPNKAITPWRDKTTGKFTSKNNKNKKIAYQYEYILIMKKDDLNPLTL